MWNSLIQALCELTQKMDALLLELRGSTTSMASQQGRRIGTSISPVLKQAADPVKLVNPNPMRLGVIIQNSSDGEFMIALDENRIDERYYTFRLKPGETLHMDERHFKELYKGGMMGLWDEATGAGETSKALVTELFWSR
ncbi:hypothetical protein NC796_02555 [Aliifodinibius sp. S!AR15-10]|uniref:hypothetical protein n=1 Tax=Aliifodinibius sp. S!AR15-10 TaxID=2950437 RepID=UPI00285C74F5|nr:hypothetical protein [Aliifodinibius sp. S!AR15-10]MDR8390003.1 hypothetical protein [Aliifodinibius sp. S!AR15-10]